MIEARYYWEVLTVTETAWKAPLKVLDGLTVAEAVALLQTAVESVPEPYRATAVFSVETDYDYSERRTELVYERPKNEIELASDARAKDRHEREERAKERARAAYNMALRGEL